MLRDGSDEEIITVFFEFELESYEKGISKLEILLNSEESSLPKGIYPAHIYYSIELRMYISWELSYLEKRENDISGLEAALAPLDERFHRIRDAHLEKYVSQLLKNLQSTIENLYPDYVIKDDDFFEAYLRDRNAIEAIRQELEQFTDISKELEELRKQDEIFINLIPEAVRLKTYFPDDLVEAPPEIWWRHLEEKYGKMDW